MTRSQPGIGVAWAGGRRRTERRTVKNIEKKNPRQRKDAKTKGERATQGVARATSGQKLCHAERTVPHVTLVLVYSSQHQLHSHLCRGTTGTTAPLRLLSARLATDSAQLTTASESALAGGCTRWSFGGVWFWAGSRLLYCCSIARR